MHAIANSFAGLMAIFAAGLVLAADEPAARPPLFDPSILLLRDTAVRDALICTADQRSSLDNLLQKHNATLLAIRDAGPTGADESVQPALAEIRRDVGQTLTDEQRQRLQGMILQFQGYDALLRKDITAELQFTAAELKQLTTISDDFHRDSQHLRDAQAGLLPDQLQAGLNKLQAGRHKRILAVLSDEQEKRWSQLLGAPFDFKTVRASPADAPEFEHIEAWLNSDPLTLQSLRGQVVVIHFFAFGCGNCINNYPWYREWTADFAGKGVTIIGIHTPETAAEADNEQLRLSLAKNELTFPVAVDKEKAMWQAWHNGIWPAVYIIDKQGRLRYWWYGELDWQGAGNQKVARQQIEQLLAE